MGVTASDLDNIRYEEIVLAALLHDIGKIAQRAEDKGCEKLDMEGQILPKARNADYYTHRHALYTYGALEELCKEIGKYIDIRPPIVASVAAKHHAPSHWAEHIIAESDRLSSGADRKENEEDTIQKGSYFTRAQTQALQSVFSSVTIHKQIPEKVYYKAASLNQNTSYPVKQTQNSKDVYKEIWEGLKKSIYSIHEKDFNNYLAALDAALEYWTWAVPSSTKDQPDISLYDHAKTTAAFATVLFSWYKKEQENVNIENAINNQKLYGLITGDVSGIQNYLFDLKTTYRSTKILRARSFEIRAITDSVSQFIIDKFNINRFCLLSSAGGRFTILLPNLKNAANLMDEIREEIDVFFIKKYAGSLAICISDIQECSKIDFLIDNNNFTNTFKELQKKSNVSKQKKLQRGVIKAGHIIDDYYDKINASNQVCKMCEVKPISADDLCGDCNNLRKIGEALPKADFIKIGDTGIPLFNNIRIALKPEKDEKGLLSVNNYKDGYGLIKLPYTIPRNEYKEGYSFSEIAKQAKGVHNLAMFKADLDNLGLVFSKGLGENLSVSRYATLSRMLDYFFSVIVREIIEENWKDSIYCVYSGGDDICVIGAWDKIIDFAIKIQNEFEKFVGNNKNITISGGIAFTHQGLPIARVADMAEYQLEQSKGKQEKNAITVINIRATWPDFKKYIELGKDLDVWIKEKLVSTRFSYKLLIYSEKAKGFKEGNINEKNALWKSHYLYTLKRNIKKDIDETIKAKLKELSVNPDNMILSGISATYGLYSNRIREESNAAIQRG